MKKGDMATATDIIEGTATTDETKEKNKKSTEFSVLLMYYKFLLNLSFNLITLIFSGSKKY